jgi:uncharacterized membrane protein
MIIPSKYKENKQDRPKIRPVMGPADWVLEIIALLLILGYFGYLLYYYPKLPATIPSHFNGSGEADGYSDRGTIWALPGIALFTYLLLTVVARAPHTFNFTQKITPQNALYQYTLALRLIRSIKVLTTCIFLAISFAMVSMATKQTTGLGLWFIPIFIVLTFLPVIAYLILASRKN